MQDFTKDCETLSNLHHETRETIETEVTRAIDIIRIHKRMAGVVDASWIHHDMTTTVSEAGAGARALLICKMIRDATIAKESLLCFTEKFLFCHSLLQYDALQGKAKSPIANNKDKNIKETVVKILKQLDSNIKEMQQELDHIEEMVNMEATCMQDLKSMMNRAEGENFRSFDTSIQGFKVAGSSRA